MALRFAVWPSPLKRKQQLVRECADLARAVARSLTRMVHELRNMYGGMPQTSQVRPVSTITSGVLGTPRDDIAQWMPRRVHPDHEGALATFVVDARMTESAFAPLVHVIDGDHRIVIRRVDSVRDGVGHGDAGQSKDAVA